MVSDNEDDDEDGGMVEGERARDSLCRTRTKREREHEAALTCSRPPSPPITVADPASFFLVLHTRELIDSSQLVLRVPMSTTFPSRRDQ